MAGNLSVARENLAERILAEFKDKITGAANEPVVGDNPENKFFVGKLLTKDGDGNSGYSSDVFIESVGADFYVSQSEIENAEVKVSPRGEFYYRCYPTLEQQRAAMLEEANDYSPEPFESFEALAKAYAENPEKFKRLKVKLIPVYKKISIASPNFFVQFKPGQLLDETGAYGFLDEQSGENVQLMDQLNTLKESLNEDEDRYTYVVREKTKVSDLYSVEAFKLFIARNSKRDVIVNQNWSIYINVTVKKIKDQFLVSVALVNDSKVQSNEKTHQSNKRDKDKPSIETLFNSGVDISLSNAEYTPIELDYFLDDYKYDKEQRAVGLNCSVTYSAKGNTISTDHLPTFIQKRLVTNDKLAVKFQDLIDQPLSTLKNIRKKMDVEIQEWRDYYTAKAPGLTENGKKKMQEEIFNFQLEIDRFKLGVDTIANYPIVLKSFVLMNRAFQQTAKKYDTWRLFQIVFIVSLVPDIVACDENIMPPEDKAKTTLSEVSLLYFPTGGGKTEAFLGVLVFNLFFDRFRGKNCGVTSILRYPLRLLSVQQVQRLANTLAQAELLRQADPLIKDTEEFSLGYFVGDNNTPNNIKRDRAIRYRDMQQEELDEERILDICPFCGKPTVHLKFNEEAYRLMHFCDNPDCPSGDALPIYMVDYEIYRYLPSAIISTVDKMAIVGNNPSFRNILAGAPMRCPRHGFTSTRKCLVAQVSTEFCDEEVQNFEEVSMYDPAPTLFIQDELHLIRESLGTYASHYESFVDYFVQNVSPSRRKIKIIGATATISSYREQISQLYNGRNPIRFPCSSPYPDRNFYSFINKSDTQRLVMGYAPYGKAIINSVVYSLKYMREVVYSFVANPQKVLKIPGITIDTVEEAMKILEDYWIFLEYNNVKRDGNNVEGALDTPIDVELRKEGVPEFQTRKMTGDETFQDVRDVLSEVENTENVFGGVNLIVATSMISHGVDADRFNVMFFYGVPGNTAEYIQAYSRTGRRYSSIVVDIIRPSRETDRSYLNNFVKFHEFKDILVEPVPINRWATKAIRGTLPGIFAGLLYTQYDPVIQYSIGTLFVMNNIKKAIQQGLIVKETVLNQLLQAYGCEAGGEVVDLGNQYRESITAFVDKMFTEIVDRNWADEKMSDGFRLIGYNIMTSLRDTDEQLIIELEA